MFWKKKLTVKKWEEWLEENSLCCFRIDEGDDFFDGRFISGNERVSEIEKKLDLILDHLGLEAAMSEPSELTLYEKEEV